MATGDFNKDNLVDMVTANYSDNTVSVLFGNANGTFQARTTFAVGSGPSAVTIGDFNVGF